MRKFLSFLLIVSALAGCKSTESSKKLHYDYFIREAEIEEPKITRSSVVCDIDIDFTKRVMGTSREHTGVDRAERAKEEAYFNALINNNVDVLVSPIYQVEQTEKTATAVAYGFAGMYVNARSKTKALEEVQKIDSSAFYKYELVWEGAKIAPSDDIILHSKGESICTNCPGNTKGKNGADNGTENKPTTIYTQEKIVFNPYGPKLIYPSTFTTRKERKLLPFRPLGN